MAVGGQSLVEQMTSRSEPAYVRDSVRHSGNRPDAIPWPYRASNPVAETLFNSYTDKCIITNLC